MKTSLPLKPHNNLGDADTAKAIATSEHPTGGLDETTRRLIHDLSHGLTHIGLAVDGLKLTLASGDSNPFVQSIDYGFDYCRELIKRIPDPRLDEAQRRSTDVQALLKRMTAHLRASLPERIDLQLKITSPLPQVVTIPFLCKRLLHNVADNAHAAMSGKGRLTIMAASLSSAGHDIGHEGVMPGGIIITVSDTGAGMTADQLHDCQAFLAGQNSLRTSFGQGMSVVKQAADLLGARVNIASLPGGGTQVAVQLPASSECH